MKTLYLHIGAGKTGSSALQVWLHQNSAELLKHGIFYPTENREIKDDYTITSGNGVTAVKSIKSEAGEIYLGNLISKTDKNILLSSESFQTLSTQEVEKIKKFGEKNSIKITPIIYLRDIYDVIHSGYSQLIKRHGLFIGFQEYAKRISSIQQISVLELWSSIFEDIKVIHYDTNKLNLDKSLLFAIEVNSKEFPPLKPKKVNRSLTIEELDTLRAVNRALVEGDIKNIDKLDTIISNEIISVNPEKETEIIFSEEIFRIFKENYSSKIIAINKKYFNGNNVLQLFRREGKNILLQKENAQETISLVLNLLIKEVTKNPERYIKQSLEQQKSDVAISGRVVDIIRDEAIRREKENIQESISLMQAAHILRPTGEFIKSKLAKYKNLYNKDKR